MLDVLKIQDEFGQHKNILISWDDEQGRQTFQRLYGFQGVICGTRWRYTAEEAKYDPLGWRAGLTERQIEKGEIIEIFE